MYEIEEMIRQFAKPMPAEKFILLARDRGWKQYCKCVIDKNGLVYDLRGGHIQMMSGLAAREMGVTVKEYYDTTPKAYWFDTNIYAMKQSGALPVRFEFILSLGDPNDKQKETISKLVDAGLVLDKVVIENDILEGNDK